jgi:hypothetical protein
VEGLKKTRKEDPAAGPDFELCTFRIGWSANQSSTTFSNPSAYLEFGRSDFELGFDEDARISNRS